MNTSEVHVAMCNFFQCVFVCWVGLKGRTCVFVVDLLMISRKAHYQAERPLQMTQLQLVHHVQCVSAVSFLSAHNDQCLTKQINPPRLCML